MHNWYRKAGIRETFYRFLDKWVGQTFEGTRYQNMVGPGVDPSKLPQLDQVLRADPTMRKEIKDKFYNAMRMYNEAEQAAKQDDPQAYNKMQQAAEEMKQLSVPTGRLQSPLDSDQATDESFGRAIYLRRQAGKARVTIFEGGHEAIDRATVVWLARHAKEARQ